MLFHAPDVGKIRHSKKLQNLANQQSHCYVFKHDGLILNFAQVIFQIFGCFSDICESVE